MKKTGIGVKNKVLAAMCIVVLGMAGTAAAQTWDVGADANVGEC